MSDLFDNFNKILKNDLVPILAKYLKDQNNKKSDILNDFLNDPQTLLSDIFEKFSKYKDMDNNQMDHKDIEKVDDIDPAIDSEYDELFKRLVLIEENMSQIKKILKDKN